MEEYAHLASAPAGDDSGSTSKAIMAGVAAAAAGGVVWALIVMVANYELGIVAWGVGALVGFAMAATTAQRSMGLGVTAAGIALGGLLLGKLLIAVFVMGGVAADEILEDPELMQQAAMFDLEVNSGFPAGVQAEYDAVPDGDTLSDALWSEMLAAADARLQGLDEEGERAVATQFAQMISGEIGEMPLADRVTAQFSGFDLLWVFFALGTAWKMMAARDEEEVVATE